MLQIIIPVQPRIIIIIIYSGLVTVFLVHIVMNNTTCSHISYAALSSSSASNGVSALVCLVSIILLFALKFHKIPLYRLALYQVFAAFAYAFVIVTEIGLIEYPTACKAAGFLDLFLLWVKLLLSGFLTFHLFSFAVFHKNLKRFELFYVVTCVLVPAGVATVPLITDTYGVAGSRCWIKEANEHCEKIIAGLIESLVLCYGPVFIILVAECVAMVVMVAVVAYRVCKRWKSQPLIGENQQQKALKHILPFVVYPFIFCICSFPPLINRLYNATHKTPSQFLQVVTSISVSISSFAAGIVLIIHITISRIKRRSKTSRLEEEGVVTANETLIKSTTYYSRPAESVY